MHKRNPIFIFSFLQGFQPHLMVFLRSQEKDIQNNYEMQLKALGKAVTLVLQSIIQLKYRNYRTSFFSNGRFNNNTNTVGYVDENSRGHCISPLLYETGWVPLHISSDNGKTFSRVGAWLSGTIIVCIFLKILKTLP